MTASVAARTITARHYQALCGLALATVFLLQLQHSAEPQVLFLNVTMLLIGAVCVLFPVRFSPILFLLAFAAAQLLEQYNQNQFVRVGSRFAFLNLTDVLLCMAMLTYIIGQYRLNGLRFGVIPDARAKAIPKRSEDSLLAAELVALIFPVPLCALAGQLAMLLIMKNWGFDGVNPVWRQLFGVAWALLLGIFLAAHAFRYWKRMQMTRAMAMLMLHDILWSETGGEQRRIQRWIAWRKLAEKRGAS